MTQSLPSITVVGAGAVGGFFGAMLARAGCKVTLIGRAQHVAAIETSGLQLHMAGKLESVKVAATTDIEAVRGADIVLFCVKSLDTDAVARQIAPLLGPSAIVLSLQNGVDNAMVMKQHIRQTVVPAVVYVATAMPEPGVIKHYGRGDLVIGAMDRASANDAAQQKRLKEIADMFIAANVPVQISPDVIGELWRKLLVNCSYNAISALAQMPYGKLHAVPDIEQLQRDVVREVVAVAQADGQTLTLEDAQAASDNIAVSMPAQFSSTAQDIARGKLTEIGQLNGFVVRRGAELAVATPVNQTLYALVRLLEARGSDSAA